MYNIYLVSPHEDPEPSHWVTEVCVPIAPVGQAGGGHCATDHRPATDASRAVPRPGHPGPADGPTTGAPDGRRRRGPAVRPGLRGRRRDALRHRLRPAVHGEEGRRRAVDRAAARRPVVGTGHGRLLDGAPRELALDDDDRPAADRDRGDGAPVSYT